MNNTFSFRPATEADVPRILEIISHRIEWLGKKGIDQWTGEDNYLAYYTPVTLRSMPAWEKFFWPSAMGLQPHALPL